MAARHHSTAMNPSFSHFAFPLLLASTLLTTPLLAENVLTVQRTAQSECRVSASMGDNVGGLQFTLVASEGMTITSVRCGAGIRSDAYIFASNALDQRTMRVVVLGRRLGDVLRGAQELLIVNVERTSSAGGLTIRLEGVVLSDEQGSGLGVTVAGLLWTDAFAGNSVAGMLGNFPNPFNPSTMVSYELKQPSHVRLTIHDMLGRELAELVNEELAAGAHQAPWIADPRTISSGVYFARLSVGSQVLVHRMAITH